MIEFRSVEHLEVLLNDVHVADLYRKPNGCEFAYKSDYLQSGGPSAALNLPKGEPIVSEGVLNLPPFFAGLLPEGVMFSAVRSVIRSAPDDLFSMLAAVGSDAIGDVTVRLPGVGPSPPSIDLEEATQAISNILEQSGSLPGATIPGVQPKLSIGGLIRTARKAAFIVKFESPEFPGIIENELACMKLARRVGIDAASVQTRQGKLIVKRFDRIPSDSARGLSRVHVEDMLQVLDRYPASKYSLEYIDLLKEMERLYVSKAEIMRAMQLYVFSYLIGNGDLHAKNVSLIRTDEGQWILSPAYDLLSTLPYSHRLGGADRMALALVDEAYGKFTVDDFVGVGRTVGLPEEATRRMVAKTVSSVNKWAEASLGESLESVVDQVLDRCRTLG